MTYPLTPNYYDMEKNQNMLQVPKMVGHPAKIANPTMKNSGKQKTMTKKKKN